MNNYLFWHSTPQQLLQALSINVPDGFYKISGNGYVFWIPKDLYDVKIALCAHVDTVWNQKAVVVTYDGRSVYSADKNTNYYSGLGADDRAGVAVSIEMTKRKKFIHMFFDREEKGCEISRNVNLKEILPFDVDFFIGLDRRGTDQAAIYGMENKFIKKMLADIGAKVVNGTVTDCSVLARRYNKCCFNLSVGFNDEHTSNEILDVNGMVFAVRILDSLNLSDLKNQVPEPSEDKVFKSEKSEADNSSVLPSRIVDDYYDDDDIDTPILKRCGFYDWSFDSSKPKVLASRVIKE